VPCGASHYDVRYTLTEANEQTSRATPTTASTRPEFRKLRKSDYLAEHMSLLLERKLFL
jgi:hypothetical protein